MRVNSRRTAAAPDAWGRVENLRSIGADPTLTRRVSRVRRYLGDTDSEVRYTALELLKEIGSRRDRDAVLPLLSDPDPLIRVSALECLGRWGSRSAWGRVSELLHDSDSLVRAYAAWALGRMRTQQVVVCLKRALANEADELARGALLEALTVRTRDSQYLEDLIELFWCAGERARGFIVNSLVGVALAVPRFAERIEVLMHEAVLADPRADWRALLSRNLALLRK